MATVKNIKKGYCDDVYAGLSELKTRIMAMRENLERTYGAESAVFGTFDRHLGELVEQIDWKIQILSHACPTDWKGSDEYNDNTVSVGPTDHATANSLAGGYLGG